MAQAARSLLIFKRRHPLSDFALLSKANFRLRHQEEGLSSGSLTSAWMDLPALAGICDAVYALTALAATQHCITFEVSIVFVGMIQRVMEATAFFATQRRIDDHGGHRRQIT